MGKIRSNFIRYSGTYPDPNFPDGRSDSVLLTVGSGSVFSLGSGYLNGQFQTSLSFKGSDPVKLHANPQPGCKHKPLLLFFLISLFPCLFSHTIIRVILNSL